MLDYAKQKANVSVTDREYLFYLLLLQKPKKPPPPVKTPGLYDVHAGRCLCKSSTRGSSKMQKLYMTSEENSEVALYFPVLKLP